MTTPPNHAIPAMKSSCLSATLLATLLGACALSLHPANAAPPSNDSFASRTSLGSSATVNTVGNNTDATLEPGEINPSGYGGASVWYQWTAPSAGWVTIHTVAGTAANALDTLIALYSGNGSGGLAPLQMLGFNDESMRNTFNGYATDFPAAVYPDERGSSRLVFHATAGEIYQIAVHGYDDGSGAVEGPFELHIASEPVPGLRATALSATPSSVDVTSATQSFTQQVTFVSTTPLDLGNAVGDGSDSIGVDHERPDGTGFGHELVLGDRTGGDASNGTYSISFTIPRYSPPGEWILGAWSTFAGVNYNWTPSRNDNRADDYLIPPPVAGTLTVINTGAVDTTGPDLTAFNVSSTTVNNSVADQMVIVTMTVTDDYSGVDPATGSVQLSNPIANSGTSALFSDAVLISGTAQNGVYELAFTLPSTLPPGLYYWDVNVDDHTRNNSEFSGLPPPYSGTTDPLLAAKTITVGTGPVAEIAVTRDGSPLSDLGTPADLGAVDTGSSGTPVSFTITNTGTANLTGLAVTKSGTHGGDYALNTSGTAATLAPGNSTVFFVTFSPTATGLRTAAVHIASNDADENPFDINLTGTGQTPGAVSISDGLDTPSLTWSHNFTTRPFFTGQTAVTHDGADAVRTPAGLTAPSGGSNWQQLFAQATGPGTLTFWWKKTGDAGQSQLSFDWSEVAGFVFHPHASRTDTFDWQQETVNISAAGQVILNFTYAITATDTGTPEVAFIDQVVFTPSGGGGFSGWRSASFTPAELADPAVSGPLADAEKDGISNAVEYALGLEPKTNNPTPWQAGTQTVGPDQFQTIGFSVSQSSFPADATLIVEESDSLAPTATWITLATKAGTAAWAASNGGVITQGAPSGGRIPVIVRSPNAMGGANDNGFLRLRVVLP